MRFYVQEAAVIELPGLERRLGAIAAIAQVAPLVGLLGTILGMIRRSCRSSEDYPTASELAPGMWQALLSAAGGLMLAISGPPGPPLPGEPGPGDRPGRRVVRERDHEVSFDRIPVPSNDRAPARPGLPAQAGAPEFRRLVLRRRRGCSSSFSSFSAPGSSWRRASGWTSHFRQVAGRPAGASTGDPLRERPAVRADLRGDGLLNLAQLPGLAQGAGADDPARSAARFGRAPRCTTARMARDPGAGPRRRLRGDHLGRGRARRRRGAVTWRSGETKESGRWRRRRRRRGRGHPAGIDALPVADAGSGPGCRAAWAPGRSWRRPL